MLKFKNRFLFKHSYLQEIGAILILLLALLLLWRGNATSNQAMKAISAQVGANPLFPIPQFWEAQ